MYLYMYILNVYLDLNEKVFFSTSLELRTSE